MHRDEGQDEDQPLKKARTSRPRTGQVKKDYKEASIDDDKYDTEMIDQEEAKSAPAVPRYQPWCGSGGNTIRQGF